jgi:hypothetical protein
MKLVTKQELAVDEVKNIETIVNGMARDFEVLKKKIAMLRECLKEEKCVR